MNRRAKVSTRKIRRVLLPVMAMLLTLMLTITIGMNSNAAELDLIVGKGKKTVTSLDGVTPQNAYYYPQEHKFVSDSRESAFQVSKQISDEGIVLLKNDGLLPLSREAAVSPFGLRYKFPFYGGTGSSAIDTGPDYIVTPRQGLQESFSYINADIESKFASVNSAEAAYEQYIRAAVPTDGNAANTLYELDTAIYSGTEPSCRGTIGLVFLARQTGEANDASTCAYSDGTPHMLALTAAEKETIAFAKRHCDAVVVILESSAPMQIADLHDDSGVSAILWVGGAGSSGFASLGGILTGNAVPSGRLPDIYPADFKKDPTFANFDDGSDQFVYSNAYTTLVTALTWDENAPAPFHEYEEGVYVGYKYYETAYDIGALRDYYNRDNGVLYPFGYGLSYTEFSQKILSFSDVGDRINITVRVKNEGARFAGKDVVQVYFTAPYTEFDEAYRIEKPTAVLAQFGKTGLLAPDAYEDVTLSFAKEDMASYCDTRSNPDGTTGCYVLSAGTYEISLRANSHEVIERRNTSVPGAIWYHSGNPRQTETDAQSALDNSGKSLGYPAKRPIVGQGYQAAVNQFPQLKEYAFAEGVSKMTVLSRRDWSGTQPTAPDDADRHASEKVAAWIAAADTTKYQFASDDSFDADSRSLAAYGAIPAADSSLVLADLRGKSYYDPMWDILLDQLAFNEDEIALNLLQGAYQTGAIPSIGKPESTERDGPQGLTKADLSGRNWVSGTCGYPSTPVMAATWNKELMYEFGYRVGQEALLKGVNGWYAPALNTHRSPFGGRVSEYFSEDGVLAGHLAAQILSGSGDAGIYCTVKHLVLNDSEGHRNPHTATWLTEQALREIYLKPFEIALKHSTKTIHFISETQEGGFQSRTMRAGDCIMAADSAVGAYWSAANAALLTSVVRGEWGFQGFILSDMNLNCNSNRADMMLRSGCDVVMSLANRKKENFSFYGTQEGSALIRGAIKNISYTQVNSNLAQGLAPRSVIHYAESPWRIWLMLSNLIVGLLVAACGIWLLMRAHDEKKRPQKYGGNNLRG